MQQYGLHFGFREPYQVLLDAEILQDAKRFKMDFLGGLEKTLHGQVKPMITQCSMRHLYNAEPKDEELIDHAKAFERRRCGHHELEKPLSTLDCLSSVVDPKSSRTNKHRYVVASQDDRVRHFMRTIPGVPLIYLKRSVMIMEPMAGATEKVREKEEREKFRAGLTGRRNPGANAKRLREDDEENSEEDANGDLSARGFSRDAVDAAEDGHDVDGEAPAKKKRKRGPSGPNPLSMKKKKAAVTPQKPQVRAPAAETTARTAITDALHTGEGQAKTKRKRKHKSAATAGLPDSNLVDTQEAT